MYQILKFRTSSIFLPSQYNNMINVNKMIMEKNKK